MIAAAQSVVERHPRLDVAVSALIEGVLSGYPPTPGQDWAAAAEPLVGTAGLPRTQDLDGGNAQACSPAMADTKNVTGVCLIAPSSGEKRRREGPGGSVGGRR